MISPREVKLKPNWRSFYHSGGDLRFAICDLRLNGAYASISSGGIQTTLPSRQVAMGLPARLCWQRAVFTADLMAASTNFPSAIMRFASGASDLRGLLPDCRPFR